MNASVPDPPEPDAPADPYAAIVAAFDARARAGGGNGRFTRGYHELVEYIHRAIVPPGSTVLELGAGEGDLLAALRPASGVGVDVSGEMVALARRHHPELEFVHARAEQVELGRSFDDIVLSDLLPYVDDLLGLFRTVRRHCHRDTRVVVHSYSQLWRPVLRLLELLRLKPPSPVRNWVTQGDVEGLLELAGLEVVTMTRRILLPLRIPLLSALCNGVLGNLWILRHLCLTYWIVARPVPEGEPRRLSVSVVVPARDEAGMIERIVAELPEFGRETELIFVEGNSRDGTRAEILRQIELHPERNIRLVDQHGRGKGDAVRLGFAEARNEVLMILDADLTVRPSELPSFLEAIENSRAEFVNGSRLVYGMDPGAMRYLNLIGNKAFSLVFSALLDQRVKDTLCGTKVLERRRYEQIARARAYFGDFDPFGDFDLLLGAARLNLKVVDLPVRYGARTYGDTKISRFRHGVLLAQMALFAFWKLKLEIYRPPPS